jgi:hypothetical protein
LSILAFSIFKLNVLFDVLPRKIWDDRTYFLFCFVVIFAETVYTHCQLYTWDIVFHLPFHRSQKSHSTDDGSSGQAILNWTFVGEL